ncbi:MULTISPECIES: hypothetical protein [Crateriforma]|uniref:HAMP domain-containing protein n=1 Tax=Crateriforma conspicua TaxID=2527996 RepID=A0A5C6FLL5_9PLAN|nr:MULTISPECIES: hypothetical protein [Crateriforma]TWU62927.1 hypothetical protein V7x_46640 [Crateriforma conspicua]
MSASATTARRKKTIVDSEVQGGILRKIALHWVALFFCNTLALMIWLRLFEQPEAGWSEAFQECWTRFLPFFIVTMTLIPAFIWDTLKLTNRFAGPISRLRQALRDAGEGRPVGPLKFRTSDYWAEMADDFNRLIRRIASQEAGTGADSDNGVDAEVAS